MSYSLKIILMVVSLVVTAGIVTSVVISRGPNKLAVFPTPAAPPPLNPEFANAPNAVKDCVVGIIDQDAFDKLIQNVRLANTGEKDALEYCFKPSGKQYATPSSSPPKSASPPNPQPPPPPEPPKVDVYPEVWTKNGYDGPSYEFKTNCGPDYKTLNECFLWDVTRVAVTHTTGKAYELEKDFTINSYSGEITRRWVLYGPAGAGFPPAGKYIFNYYKSNTIVLSQTVDYSPSIVGAPTNMTWRREGNDLVVAWQPPEGMTSAMWYKVVVFRKNGQVLSQVVSWDASSAVLKNFPLDTGEEADLNVTSFFRGGYAYSPNIKIVW